MQETGRGEPAPIRPENVLASDVEFDRVYDAEVRKLSEQHWTPVQVAARAAALLTDAGATRILDVGSGVGKFCIVGALSTNAQFVGVEQRGRLVNIARGVATRLGAARAAFIHANVDTFSFDGFDGIYLYNPFYEQICKLLIRIDAAEQSSITYRRLVRVTADKLASLAAPAAVVTYGGFGGEMPPAYTPRRVEAGGDDRLELWVKS